MVQTIATVAAAITRLLRIAWPSWASFQTRAKTPHSGSLGQPSGEIRMSKLLRRLFRTISASGAATEKAATPSSP